MYNKHDLDELQRHLLHHLESLASDPFVLLNRVSVGFENIFDDARTAGLQDLRFPFHNLEAVEDGYLLHFTLAGWHQEEIKVQAEENKITISGEPKAEETIRGLSRGDHLVHQGITKKTFNRTIIVRPGLIVKEAWMKNGLLTIQLVKPGPVSTMREIPLTDAQSTFTGGTMADEAEPKTVNLSEVPDGHELLNEDLGDRG